MRDALLKYLNTQHKRNDGTRHVRRMINRAARLNK